MRSDLPLGLLAAQVCHAAGESAAIYARPIPEGTHAVVLGCSAEELRELARALAAGGAPHVCVREDEAPYTGQLMAIGLCPGPKAAAKPFVRKYQLLGKEEKSRV